MPGIAEEALLSLQKDQPLFLLGGFGGCTRDIAETLGLVERWAGSRPAWPGRNLFEGFSPELNNGLTEEENATLARTPHIDQANILVMRGLHRLGQRKDREMNPGKRTATMAIPNPLVKFTYEDYLNAPEDKRYELLDGELVMTPAPGELHQRTSILLGSQLFHFVNENSLGRVYHAPFDVVLSNTDVVQPDLLFVSNERGHIITPANIQGAPDLVVEILSPSSAERDRTFKRTLYAMHGVNEYWMVDPAEKTISVLLPGEPGFKVAGIYGEGETLTSTTLRGFRLNTGDIF